MDKLKLVLIFGGQSEEHEISCRSAATIYHHLDKEKYEIILVGITKKGHWLLVDSLEIYTVLRGWPYLGPKKALRQLEKKDREGYALYEKALCKGDYESLADWVGHIKARFDNKGKKKTQKEGAVT